MQNAAHSLPVLAPILAVRVLALPRPHFSHSPVPLRRLGVDVAPIGLDQVVEALPVHPLAAILATQSQHHGATGHAKAAEQDHHEEKGQLLQSAGLLSGKDLLEFHLEGLELARLFEVAGVDEKLLGVDQGVALPLDVGAG